MDKKIVKQDINFMEFPLWFQNKNEANNLESFIWEDPRGFVYKTSYKPPIKVDFIFLIFLLSKSQNENWDESIEVSRYEVLHECNVGLGKYWYERLEECLARWLSVIVSYQGTFYDGKKYRTMMFHIIDSWKLDENTKKLLVRFSPEWLLCIKNSNFFQLIDFDELKALRSPLATRLYEILVKTFHGRNRWEIGAKKLADKIPMKEEYPSDIIPKIKSAVNKIEQETSLNISLEVRRPKRGKAFFIFHKKENNLIEITCDGSNSKGSEQNIEDLLSILPEKQRKKKTIQEAIAKAFKKHSKDYVERNILYANEKAKKNYRVYLIRALKEDWGANWWEDQELEKIEEIQEQESRSQGLQALKQKAKEELAYYQNEFLAFGSQERLEEFTSHIEEKVRNTASSENFDYYRDLQLAALLRTAVDRYRYQAEYL